MRRDLGDQIVSELAGAGWHRTHQSKSIRAKADSQFSLGDG